MNTTDKTKETARLNDQFRTTFIGGKVMTTQGIEALTPDQKMTILTKVRQFDDFTEDNDPYGEHDFGAFDMPNVGKIFFKIDYYSQG